MTDQRFVIEMGMGNDLHGMDYTKAAIRAVENAMRRSSLHILGLSNTIRRDVRVKVTVGVQNPDVIEVDKIAELLPVGRPEVVVTKGGLNSTHPQTGETIVIASAAVEAFLPLQTRA